MKNKFKMGLILGGLLALGTVVSYARSKKGQQLTEEIKNDLETLTKNLKKNLGQLQDVTKDNFDELVSLVVEKYSKKKKLVADVKNILTRALQSKWSELEAEYLDE